MKWQNKINKKELKHLKESGVATLGQAKINAEHQAKIRNESKENIEPCFDCRTINRKLNFPI